MTFNALLESVAARAEEHERRALAAVEGLSSEKFNRPAGTDWSVAQVFKHLCLADEPYLNAIEPAIAAAKLGDGEVKHTLIGKLLMKVSGPGGNAPAPGFLIPPDLPLSLEVVEEWRGYQKRIVRLAELAKGKNLSHRVRNPFIKFLRMSIADMFGVVDVHNERHVQQIEARCRSAKSVS